MLPRRRRLPLAFAATLALPLLLTFEIRPPVDTVSDPQFAPPPQQAGDGFIQFMIWQEGLGFDGYHWDQLYTQEIPIYLLINSDGLGWRSGKYSYQSVHSGMTDEIWYSECGWVVEYDVQVFVSRPPACTASIVITEMWLPGFCWGCVAALGCYAEISPVDSPAEMHFEFEIGKEILKAQRFDHRVQQGATYVLLNDIFAWGGACEHEAFRKRP